MNLTLELYESARIIVRRLRPEVADMLGLRGAIEEMINTYNASHPSCHFQFKANGDCSKLERVVDHNLSVNPRKPIECREARPSHAGLCNAKS